MAGLIPPRDVVLDPPRAMFRICPNRSDLLGLFAAGLMLSVWLGCSESTRSPAAGPPSDDPGHVTAPASGPATNVDDGPQLDEPLTEPVLPPE